MHNTWMVVVGVRLTQTDLTVAFHVRVKPPNPGSVCIDSKVVPASSSMAPKCHVAEKDYIAACHIESCAHVDNNHNKYITPQLILYVGNSTAP